MAKAPNSISAGRAAKGAREMMDQKKVRQSADAQMRFQGEDLEAGRRAQPVPVPPMRPKSFAKGGKMPDLTGDGKVTRADVLKGRGVFKAGGGVKKMMAKKMAPKKKK